MQLDYCASTLTTQVDEHLSTAEKQLECRSAEGLQALAANNGPLGF
jgi:hypothetical protein